MDKMKIIIDPRLKYNYASWYLLGIYKVFNKKEISYEVEPFLSLSYKDTKDYNSGFAFVVRYDDGTERKCFIDTEDLALVFEDRYRWCDVYGMVNPTQEQVDNYDKLVAIGPEFGIPLGGKMQTVWKCMLMYLKARKHTLIPFKLYLRDYLYTNIRRRPIGHYECPTDVNNHYIFHASTLWYDPYTNAQTNAYRGAFLKACKNVGLKIGGGTFLPYERVGGNGVPRVC